MILTAFRGAASAAIALGVLALPGTAMAVVDPVNPCNVQGWFVNPDEADREPERVLAGFTFEATDLIHHAAPAGLTTADLESGDYTASPAPDQASFFSVEVAGGDGGYATLRYNRLSHQWEMVTAGQLYAHVDPDVLVDMPPVKRSHTVVRFGVGYTKNPPGSVKTTVSSVSFQGKVYYFSCPKAVDPSPSTSVTPSTSPSTSVSPSTSATPSATPSSTASTPSASSSTPGTPQVTRSLTPIPVPASEDDELPTTGASLTGLIAAAGFVLALGVFLVVKVRRKH